MAPEHLVSIKHIHTFIKMAKLEQLVFSDALCACRPRSLHTGDAMRYDLLYVSRSFWCMCSPTFVHQIIPSLPMPPNCLFCQAESPQMRRQSSSPQPVLTARFLPGSHLNRKVEIAHVLKASCVRVDSIFSSSSHCKVCCGDLCCTECEQDQVEFVIF